MVEWHKPAFDENELESLPACDLCRAPSSEFKPQFRKSGLVVNRCPRCGVLFASPRLRQDILWQRYSDEYFENEYLPIHGQYHAAHNDAIHAPALRELGRYAKPGRLFEFGAAIGLFLVAAQRAGWDVAGNELSPFAAKYAREHFQIPVTAGRGEDVQLPAGSFEAVALWETIEHVQSPQAVLRKAAELLRPGGVLALSTPNAGSASFRFLRERWWVVSPKEHIFYFSAKTITCALKQAGLTPRKIQTFGTDFPFLWNTLRGRTILPAHLRGLAAATNADGSGAAPPRPSLLRAAWLKLGPYAIGAMRRMAHLSRLGDQLVVYATKDT